MLRYSSVIVLLIMAGCSSINDDIHCPHEDCRPLSEINTERFLNKASTSEPACIVHIFPVGKSQPPDEWLPYLKELKSFYAGREIMIQVGLMMERSQSLAEQRVSYLLQKYNQWGAARVKWGFERQMMKMLPQYEEHCGGFPILVLEDNGLSRLFSPDAEPPVEKQVAKQLANRTLLVLIQ